MPKLVDRKTLLKVAALAVAFAPLLLFLYLGLFSRMIYDDFGYQGTALKFGPWQSMLWWREQWTGEYSNILFNALLSPLGIAAPASILPMVAAIGLPGLAWLTFRLTTLLSFKRHLFVVSVALSALMLAATFNGFISIQNLYSLASVVEYTLPFPTLLLLIALVLVVSERFRGRLALPLCMLSAATIAFITAGFSEMYMVFQTVVSVFVLASLLLFGAGPRHRTYLALCGAGLLGSLASWPVQLSAPGFVFRMDNPIQFLNPAPPVREILPLIARTLEEAIFYAGQPPAFAGFMLVFAAGMVAALTLGQPSPIDESRRAQTISRWVPSFGISVQLLLLPFLWTHTSDNIQVFGRFSWSFAVVIFINLGSIAAFAALLWRRVWISQMLRRRNSSMLICGAFLLVIGLLFVLTQVRSVHWRVETYLFVSAICWIIIFMRTTQIVWPSAKANRLLLLSVLSILFTTATFSAIIMVSLWGQGFIFVRTLAPVSYLLMISGLLCGLCVGVCIKRVALGTQSSGGWIKLYTILSLLVTVTIAAGIVLGQSQRIPYLDEGAKIWDANHQKILRMIENDDHLIYETEFDWRSQSFMDASPQVVFRRGRLSWPQRLFYGLEYVVNFPGRDPGTTAAE